MRTILITCAVAAFALALNLSTLGAAAPVPALSMTASCCAPDAPCCNPPQPCCFVNAKTVVKATKKNCCGGESCGGAMPCCGQKAADCCKNAVTVSTKANVKWCCLLQLDCCFPGSPCCELPDCCFPGSPCCFPGSPCCEVGADCCFPGSPCCVPGAACCAGK